VSCHVLFVDDEPENLVVFEAACAERFAVLTASSAQAALELMRTHEVAVLIADQRMPEVTGLQLLERVAVEFPQTVRMLVTAYADLTSAIDAINRGRVRRYLRKPWEVDELLATLTEGVEFYQMSGKLCALERRLRETERVYSLGVITAGLARELRGPVGAVRTITTRVRERAREIAASVPGGANGGAALRAKLLDLDEDLGEAIVSAGRALDVVRGIEIPTGQVPDQTADFSEVLRLTMRLMQFELRSIGSLELDVRPVPNVVGSIAQIGQVVLNLLINALDAMIDSPRDKRALTIRLVSEPSFACFEVMDTGPGIAPELVPLVFDASPSTARPRGAGLGLVIAKAILDEIGGSIEVEGGPSGGALFRARLRTAE
jgi:two-component system, NtrC family, sensor kinase